MTADEALQILRDGNARFRDERSTLSEATSEKPFAIVHGCIDSRVAPSLVFDQPPRSFFVSQTAGAIETDQVAHSVDFAVQMGDLSLVLVLGHTDCAAVHAAQQKADDGWLDSIRTNIEGADDPYEAQALGVAKSLVEHSAFLQGRIAEQKTAVVPAVYDVHTRSVRFLDPVQGIE